MRKSIILIAFTLLATIGVAQNTRTLNGMVCNSDGRAIVGAIIKAVDEGITATSTQGGAFEIKVSPYCRVLEASFDGYHSAQIEVDGSFIVFRLNVDKKYAENKAKAEAERKENEEKARIAAEKEAAAKAKAEEQARIAAEKEAAAKAEAEHKAQEQARITAEKEAAAKAKAEEQARVAAEREAAAKAEAERKAQEQARITAEKEAAARARAEEQARIAAYNAEANKGLQQSVNYSAVSNTKKGKVRYGQFAEISLPIGIMFGDAAVSTNFNYIGGCRINERFFLGIGTGLNLNFGAHSKSETELLYSDWQGPQYGECYYYSYISVLSLPIYLHFRTDFSEIKSCGWNPYASVSFGSNLGVAGHIYNDTVFNHPISDFYNHYVYEYGAKHEYMFLGVDVGFNRKINNNISIYMGVGYKLSRQYYIGFSDGAAVGSSACKHSVKISVGLSF